MARPAWEQLAWSWLGWEWGWENPEKGPEPSEPCKRCGAGLGTESLLEGAVGEIPTLAAQMGQEQGGTGTAPLAPLLQPCICLPCPCTLVPGFMLGSCGLETTLLPPAPLPPLILLWHFAPRRPSTAALCAWCLVLSASILITRTTEKANVLCRTWYKSQQYLESVESAQKMFMEAEKNIKR